MSLDISIIISTYNSPDWLEKVLHGYNNQTYRNFEIVIADDGSGPETRDLIERMRKEMFYPFVHVWHEDDGFQKSQILNKAIVQCSTEYILMSDGDCIPRKDFVAQHVKYREKGYFLSGGYFMLPLNISKQITPEDIYKERCFSVSWLKENGLKSSFKNNKLSAGPAKAHLLNRLTPTNASWNGHNASGWKEDIVAVNGFDERMQYGGQDRELGERLENLGIKSKQIRYDAVVIHLDHPRGYKNQRSIDKNLSIREYTKKQKIDFTPYGIVKEMHNIFQASVILEIGENIPGIEKVFWAYENQLQDNFELILFGNLSKETEMKIQKFQSDSALHINYINSSLPDAFQKAIEAASSEYLIISNDRAIPRYDFVAVHTSWRKAEHLVFSGIIEVPGKIMEEITREEISTQACFTQEWMVNHHVKKCFSRQLLTHNKVKKRFLNRFASSFVPVDKNHFSVYKKDVLSIHHLAEKSVSEWKEELIKSELLSVRIPFSTIVLLLK